MVLKNKNIDYASGVNIYFEGVNDDALQVVSDTLTATTVTSEEFRIGCR